MEISKIKNIMNIIIIVLITIFISSASHYFIEFDYKDDIKTLDTWIISIDNKNTNINLPSSLKDISKDTTVSLNTTVDINSDESLYIKTVYSPLKIYIDDKLVYELGSKEHYPSFMKTPATEAVFISPNITRKNANLKLVYKYVNSKEALFLHPVYLGKNNHILFNLLNSSGTPFTFSIILLITGLIIILISFLVMIVEKTGVILLYIGIFALSSGTWGFGESNLSILLVKNYALLYLLSFIGLFTFMIPIPYFLESVIKFKNKKSINSLSVILASFIVLAFILQLIGIVPFNISKYAFHIIIPLSLVFLTLLLLYEWKKYRNIQAIRFCIPIGILTLGGIAEVVNYIFKFSFLFSMFFQIGIFFFIISAGIISGFYIKDIIRIKNKEQEASFEIGLIKSQISEQKKQHKMMLDMEENIKMKRHDLRHHLALMKMLVDKENTDLNKYLDELSNSIPSKFERYCENLAVNSIVTYYANICKNKGIDIDININVPEHNKNISDSELSVILGNLLENAIEASSKVTEGKKFIVLKSIIQNSMLIITMDNSFDGKILIKNKKYISSKTGDFGIGLSSITSIAKKSGGDAKFKKDGYVFLSNIYLMI